MLHVFWFGRRKYPTAVKGREVFYVNGGKWKGLQLFGTRYMTYDNRRCFWIAKGRKGSEE